MGKLTTQAKIISLTNPENENFIIQSIVTFLDCNISYEKITEIQIALSEAVNNVITFAYPNKRGKISVSVSLYSDNSVKIKIRDYGCGIVDVEKAKIPFFTTQNEHSGMGFTIMDSISDKLTVKSTVGKGTLVILEFFQK